LGRLGSGGRIEETERVREASCYGRERGRGERARGVGLVVEVRGGTGMAKKRQAAVGGGVPVTRSERLREC